MITNTDGHFGVSLPTAINLNFDDVGMFKIGGQKYIREDLTEKSLVKMPKIKDCIFNEYKTIVIWEDGTKTIVECQPGDTWNDEMGVLECIAKKAYGNKGAFNKIVMDAVKQGNIHYKKQIARDLNKDLRRIKKGFWV